MLKGERSKQPVVCSCAAVGFKAGESCAYFFQPQTSVLFFFFFSQMETTTGKSALVRLFLADELLLLLLQGCLCVGRPWTSLHHMQSPLQHVGFRSKMSPALIFRGSRRQQTNSSLCGSRLMFHRRVGCCSAGAVWSDWF